LVNIIMIPLRQARRGRQAAASPYCLFLSGLTKYT
jgi:hypothetical protein